jgi:hypothetical protein
MINNLVPKDYRIPKDSREKNPYPFPVIIPTTKDKIHAKCPKCNRITNIRICYGCKELMCEECLKEHQIGCFAKGR